MLNEIAIIEGVIIGAAGGACAGLILFVLRLLSEWTIERRDRRRIFSWLKKHTCDAEGEKFRSTRAIASWNNLTEDRVRYICSVDRRIFLSTGDREDIWALQDFRQKKSPQD